MPGHRGAKRQGHPQEHPAQQVAKILLFCLPRSEASKQFCRPGRRCNWVTMRYLSFAPTDDHIGIMYLSLPFHVQSYDDKGLVR